LGIHDKGYKRILSKKENFLKFLNRFVKKGWIDSIDPDDLELIDKEFIPKDFREKSADIIYKAKINGKEVYFYIILELQSSVDFSMPFRLLVYVTELKKRLFMNADKDFRVTKGYKMPCVIPIVLYNGREKWTVPKSYKEYQEYSEVFKDNVLNFKYILVSLRGMSTKGLLKNADLISSIFAIDKTDDQKAIIKTLLAVLKMFNKFSIQEQVDFVDWLRDVLLSKYQDATQVEDVVTSFKVEDGERMVHAMEALLDKVENRGRQEGRQEVIREMEAVLDKTENKGIRKGRQEASQEIELIVTGLNEGKSPEVIAEDNDIPIELVLRWKELLKL